MEAMGQELNFEDALTRLEEIVHILEQGNLPLEESLKVFEEGIRLSRFCMQKLNEAEKKIEILVRDKDQTILRPFLSPEGNKEP